MKKELPNEMFVEASKNQWEAAVKEAAKEVLVGLTGNEPGDDDVTKFIGEQQNNGKANLCVLARHLINEEFEETLWYALALGFSQEEAAGVTRKVIAEKWKFG